MNKEATDLSGKALWPNHPLTFAYGEQQLQCPGCGGHISPRKIEAVEDVESSEVKQGYHIHFGCDSCYADPVLGIITLLGDTWVGWVRWSEPREEEFRLRQKIIDLCDDLARGPVIP